MTELSNKLKEARLSLGLSLDDLQASTKIQKRYLLGIEEGNYSMIPGPFYVRAFIKQYAEAVNLDPEELFEEYKSEIPSTHSEDFPEKLSRVQTRKSVAPGNSKIFDLLPKLLIGVFVIGAIALAYFLIINNRDADSSNEPAANGSDSVQLTDKLDEKEQEEAKEDSEKTTSTNEVEAEEEDDSKVEPQTQQLTVVETKGKETIFELKNATKFELKLVSTGETWVNIKNGNGNSFWQGILKKGTEESKVVDFSKEQEAVIVVGNSVATEIYVNDQKLEYSISPTDQVTQNITIRYVPATASE